MNPGQRQREVISVLERALAAVEAGDATGLAAAAVKVQELNALPTYDSVPALLAQVADALEREDALGVSEALRELAGTLGPGPLAARVERMSARWATG